MNLTDQITSLELSQRLFELGVKQISIFCWSFTETVPNGGDYKLYYKGDNAGGNILDFSAYTASELLEMLPSNIEGRTLRIIKNWDNTHSLAYPDLHNMTPTITVMHHNISCALGYMLAHLIENKLMELP